MNCAVTARVALERVSGVHSAAVSFDSGTAVVRFDPEVTSPQQFIERLAYMTGFQAMVVASGSERNGQRGSGELDSKPTRQ